MRQRIHRLFGRREFLILTPQLIACELEGRPFARWAHRAQIDRRLGDLERLLVEHGPNNPEVRTQVRTEAARIELTIDRSELHQWARAKGLLCEAGVEAGEDDSSMMSYAADAVRLYHSVPRKERDRMHYAREAAAFLRYSNVCRNCGDKRIAGQAADIAYDMLKTKCDCEDPVVMRLLHQADVRAVRLLAEGRGETDLLRDQRDEMIRLATEIDDSVIQLETARELAGYLRMSADEGRTPDHRRKIDLAHQELMKIDALLQKTRGRSLYDAPTLLRPRIEWFLASERIQDKEEGIRLIQEDYMALYRQNQHKYYEEVLRKWCRRPTCTDRGLSFEKLRVPRATYNSPILLSLPRGF
jgi:hypothetical protein